MNQISFLFQIQWLLCRVSLCIRWQRQGRAFDVSPDFMLELVRENDFIRIPISSSHRRLKVGDRFRHRHHRHRHHSHVTLQKSSFKSHRRNVVVCGATTLSRTRLHQLNTHMTCKDTAPNPEGGTVAEWS